jgi:stress response protein YsnF
MITQEQLSTVLDHPVYGDGGQKIGEARHVFYDDATGQPEWVTVKTGLFGGSESFVPIHDAVLAQDHLEVPYSKDKIKAAPNVDVDAGGHLSVNEEHRLYDFYGIDWDAALQRFTEQQPTRGQGPGQQAADQQAIGQPAAQQQAGAAAGTAQDAMTRSEEQMHVGVERHEAGRARLRKYVVTEEQEQTVPVRHEEARLVREPITEANRGDAMSGPEISEAEHEVILHEETPVVETRAEPKERVRLDVDEHTEQTTVRGTVRKEQINVEDPDDDQRD